MAPTYDRLEAASGGWYDPKRTGAEMETHVDALSELMTRDVVTVAPDASLDDALSLLMQHGFRHLPVVEDGAVVGILSDRNLRLATSMLPTPNRLEDLEGQPVPGPERVEQIMTAPVFTLAPDASVAAAAKAMAERGIGAIPMVSGGALVGIVTETNLLRAFADRCARGDATLDDVARSHMHEPFASVGAEIGMDEALDAMDDQVAHLAVVEDGELVGVLSQRDLFVGLARDEIEDLRAQSEGQMPEPTAMVSEVMSRRLVLVDQDAPLSQCVEMMLTHQVSALPVMNADRPIGVLTQRAILAHLAASP